MQSDTIRLGQLHLDVESTIFLFLVVPLHFYVQSRVVSVALFLWGEQTAFTYPVHCQGL